jgi:hypothetical protein
MKRYIHPAGAFAHNRAMTTPRHLLGFALLALGLGSIAFGALARGGEVYKWTDSKGNVHYADRSDGAPNTVKLTPKLPPPDPASLAELEVVRDGVASDVYVSNRLGGPIEVALSLSESNNVVATPALPLRQLLPAR